MWPTFETPYREDAGVAAGLTAQATVAWGQVPTTLTWAGLYHYDAWTEQVYMRSPVYLSGYRHDHDITETRSLESYPARPLTRGI